MATKKTKTNKKATIEEQQVYFITDSQVIRGPGMTEHGGRPTDVTKKVEEVRQDFARVMNQLNYMINEADKNASATDFVLDEITISLGFSAKGKIAFIAEAGVEASIEVKFKRR